MQEPAKKDMMDQMKFNRLLRAVAVCLGVFLSVSAAAQTSISPEASRAVDDFMTFRMNLASYRRPEDALLAIERYHNEHLSEEALSGFSEQETLILRNFEVLERYNFMREIPSRKEETVDMLKAQYKVLTSWIAARKGEEFNKWLLTTAGDILSCNLSYARVSQILRDGRAVKNYYERALLQDDSMEYALTNLGQWYYYAPAVGGGSKSKAGDFFERAVEGARTDAETYYAKIFLSQYRFEDKKRRHEAAALLSEADSLQPGGFYVAWIRKINEQGYSLFYWNTHNIRTEDDD